MSYIDMAVGSLNVTVGGSPNEVTQFTAALRSSTGSNIVTTGGAFVMQMVPNQFGMNGLFAGLELTLALLSYASGNSVITTTTPATGIDKGTYNAELFFTPSGGSIQCAARGTVTVI